MTTAPPAIESSAPSEVLRKPPPPTSRGARGRSKAQRAWLHRLGLPLISALTLLTVWWGVSAVGEPDPTLRPSPLLVWNTFVELSTLENGGYEGLTWWQHLEVSLWRVGIGAGAGIAAGLVLGLAMGVITPIRIALEPFLTFVRNLPPLAYFSLIVIWFGIDEAPKIILLAIAALPPVAVVTAHAVSGTARDLLEAGRSIGLGRAKLISDVVIPSALPDVLTGIRLSVAIAYSSVVAAETINGLPGIGGMVRDAQAYNNTAVVLVGIFAIGFSGLLIDAAISAVAKRLTPWRGLA